MKEILRPVQINSENLTTLPVVPTLEGKGNIFMPEPGNGEQAPKQPEPETVVPPKAEIPQDQSKRQVTPEMVQKARERWDELNAGRVLSVDERRVQEMAIEMGKPPITGGAEAVRVTDYSDPSLQNIAQELNAEVNRVGFGNPLDPVYIQEQRVRVRDLLDRGQVDPSQANRLAGALNTWMAESQDAARAEAQEAQDAARAERRGVRDEIEDLKTKIMDHVEQRPNDLEEKARLMKEVQGIINQYPVVEASGIPHEILELASHFRETRETLINRILFKAFEDNTETNSYCASMNLYAQGNLDTLLGYLSKLDPKKYAEFMSLRTAAEFFHTMNSTVIAGNLDEFIRVAERISYQHFELMKKISGVPEVMRLYEDKYSEYLSR